MIAEISLEKN